MNQLTWVKCRNHSCNSFHKFAQNRQKLKILKEKFVFTGLIQGLGKLQPLANDQLQITCLTNTDLIFSDLAIGDSVAVDGVCLTVTQILTDQFWAIASPETLSRSILGEKAGMTVNLETSLRAGGKIGGHFVTGHVDGVGMFTKSTMSGHAWEMSFTVPEKMVQEWQQRIAPYIVEKGSIAINGISLTIADCDAAGNYLQVAVIPHTYTETNLYLLQPGDLVNVEVDILGKYVAKFMRYGQSNNALIEPDITPEFLAEHGFMMNY